MNNEDTDHRPLYVISGASGRVGSSVSNHLLRSGARVRVLVRTRVAADAWRARGAEAHEVSLEDRAALGDALEGAAGFFSLLPFDLTVAEPAAHADRLIESIAAAVADRRVPRVVMLSSVGAERTSGTGPIIGLHRLEVALRATGTRLTALRSTHFQEKVADVIEIARATGLYPVFASSADVPLPMVATVDVGVIAADRLVEPQDADEVVDVLGPIATEREVAALLGDALGRVLRVELVPEAQWLTTLTDAGFMPGAAHELAELYRADDRGLLLPRGQRAAHGSTPLAATIDALVRAG